MVPDAAGCPIIHPSSPRSTRSSRRAIPSIRTLRLRSAIALQSCFPVSSCFGSDEAFEANVDSLHILSDRPWRASRKMLHSPRRAQGLSERQRVKTCSEYRSAARTLAGAARRPATRQEIPLSCDMVEAWGDSFPFGPGGPKVARRAEGLRAPASRTRSEYWFAPRTLAGATHRPFFFQVVSRRL